MTNRRSFLTGLCALFISAPAIRASSLMPIKAIINPMFTLDDYCERILAPMVNVGRLDFLYGALYVRPEWELIMGDVQ